MVKTKHTKAPKFIRGWRGWSSNVIRPKLVKESDNAYVIYIIPNIYTINTREAHRETMP